MAETSLRYYWGIAKEVTKGTAVAPTSFPRWRDGTVLNPKAAAERILEGDGGRDSAFTFKKDQTWQPVIACYPRPIEAGLLLQAAMGAASDAITGVGPYTHTFTPQNTPSFYSIEAALLTGTIGNRVTDCIADELVIEGGAGMPVQFTTKFQGITAVRQVTPATVTSEAGQPYLFSGGTFTLESGASALVEHFKLTYKNIIEAPQTTKVTVGDLIWGRRTLDVEYGLLFTDDTLFRTFFYGSGTGTADSQYVGNGSFQALLVPGDLAGVAKTLTLTVPSVDYYGDEPQYDLTGKAVRYAIKGFAIHGAAALLTAVLVNSQATAY